MRDIYCRQCGEPYMEPSLDMNKWEYKLFMAGAGCPCCEGHPDKKWELAEDGSDIAMAAANGDGCPIERLSLFDPAYKPPKWERPEPEVLWTCQGCGVTVVVDPDNGEIEYDLPPGAKGAAWYHSHPYSRGEPTAEPYHVFQPDQPVCEFCYDKCEGCGVAVCSNLEYGDCYEDGWCSTLPNYHHADVYCIHCVESTCSKCDSLPEDCDCCQRCGETKDECGCVCCEDCGEPDCECEDKEDE
jgi:hypothetical protein